LPLSPFRQPPYCSRHQRAVFPSDKWRLQCGFLFDMMRTTPSGSYPSRIWTDVHVAGPPSPPYSPEPTSTESIFSMLPTPDYEPSCGDDPLWSSTASFLYESPLVNISLGRRVWNLRLPVYGFNGIVQGAVKLSRKCNHVARVEVSVERTLRFFLERQQPQLIDMSFFAAPGKNQNDYLGQRNDF
jgi:hypothetical protein